MESAILSELKAKTATPKGDKKEAAKKAPANKKNEAAASATEAAASATSAASTIDEKLDTAPIADAVEELEEDEPEFAPPPISNAMFLPKAKCQACTLLLPTLPRDTVFKGPGLPSKGVKPKENPCFVEPVCPARTFQMIFDPMTETRVRTVFQEYIDSGDITLLQGLYDEAEEIGEASHARLHDLLLTLMEQIHTVPIEDEATPADGPAPPIEVEVARRQQDAAETEATA